MRSDVEELLAQAARERALAASEPDHLKRSHHEEFADRYLAQALAVTADAKLKATADHNRWPQVLTDRFKLLCSLRPFSKKAQSFVRSH